MKPYIPLLALTLMIPACSLDQRIDRVSAEIERVYAKTQLWEQLPERTISWQQALSILRRENPSLQTAAARIEHLERSSLSVYTDMIPGVSIYSYFTKSIEGLTQSLATDDFRTQVNVNFYIPTITQIPYRVYSAKAEVYAAVKSREGTERDLISKLYQLVRQRDLAERRRARELRKPAEARADASPIALATEKNEHLEYWKEVSKILGDYSARWTILPESLPKFKWNHFRRQLDHLSPLVVCQHAMKLEQARLAQYGVVMEYLPTINTNLYSPSLFTSSGGTYTGTFLDTEDTTLNLNFSYRLDTRLNIWNRYQDNKARYEQVRKEVLASLLDYKQKMHLLRHSMDEYYTWRSYIMKRIDYMQHAPTDSPDTFLEHKRELESMQDELLRQEEKAIESEAALIQAYDFE